MGNPILRSDPDPLPRYRGYFCAHVTVHEVGSYPADVFVRQQREAFGSFTPLVSIEGGLLQPLWAGQRLQWVYGGLREGGAFFRVHSTGQLEYLGTAQHPSPDWLDFAGEADGGGSSERPVSPGFVEYIAQEASEDSVDEEGYHDAPAVYVGGQPAALDPGDTPTCLRCRGAMAYVGRVDSDVFSDELQEDRAIHLFYCHDCRLQCCLDAPSLDSTPLVELDLR